MNKLTSFVFAIALATTAATGIATAQSTPNNQAPAASVAMMKVASTGPFKGIEVNKGFVTLSTKGGKNILDVSDEFVIPKTPAPHWQVVDGDGNVYLLQRLTIAGDKTHREITLPSYIHSVAKVQIYCSFAEVVLGEAKFDQTLDLK